MAGQVQGANLPGLTALMKRMSEKQNSIVVGVPAGAVADEGLSMALVAAVNEFGSQERGIPERPVLRQGAHHAMTKLDPVMKADLRAVLTGKKTMDQAVDHLGVLAVGVVKAEFVSPNPPFAPNSPVTIARKGSSRPLIDTGQYRQSITYKRESEVQGAR